MTNMRRPELQRWSPHPPARQLNYTLTSNGCINFEGMCLTWLPHSTLTPGDTYLAARESGPHLLTVRAIDHRGHRILPQESAPDYDIGECYKVRIEGL